VTSKKLQLCLAVWLSCGSGPSGWCEVAGEGRNPALIQFKGSGIEADLEKREVRMDATVCLADGILEYLVCLPETYEHEAVFVTKSKPSMLHIALVLIGLQPCRFGFGAYDLWGAGAEKNRSHVRIDVEYEERGKKTRSNVCEFLTSREHKDGEVPDRWVFTGSVLIERDGKKLYAADLSGMVAGIIPSAGVIQFAEKTGNPYQSEKEGLEADPDTVPPKGTKVKLVFTPYGKSEEQKK